MIDKFALVDVETSGPSPISDRIIDIGIVLMDGFELVKEWHSLINPDCSIDQYISNMTSITDEDVLTAPRFKDVADVIETLLQGRIFVAHNVRFDYSFIRHEFERLNKRFISPHMCTVKLARKLYPEYTHHNLDALIERHNLTVDGRHRALPDAKVLYSLISVSVKEKGEELVRDAIRELCKQPALPPLIPSEIVDSLPSTIGVYTFYNGEGAPLYVGKSKHIRNRVKEHFYEDSDSLRAMEINRHTAYIESSICAGELEALITESRLVKELQPIYNKKLRKTMNIWIAEVIQNDDGYSCLQLKQAQELFYERRFNYAAFSRSKRSLLQMISKLCDQYFLCPQLSGVEPGSDGCFSHHLGKCYGACCGKEEAAIYNHRFSQAFAGTQIQTWPFKNPIVLHEYNSYSDFHTYLLVHNWAIVDIFHSLDMDLIAAHQINQTPIVLDEYHLLLTHIVKKYIDGIELIELNAHLDNGQFLL